jgi:hypothetical protein
VFNTLRERDKYILYTYGVYGVLPPSQFISKKYKFTLIKKTKT